MGCEFPAVGFPRRQMAWALANTLAIDIRAVAATEIVYPDPRRLHFQTAMAARDYRVLVVCGHLDVTILGPTDDAPGGLLEDIFISRKVSQDDGQSDSYGLHTCSIL
jgi:hypothetical protein